MMLPSDFVDTYDPGLERHVGYVYDVIGGRRVQTGRTAKYGRGVAKRREEIAAGLRLAPNPAPERRPLGVRVIGGSPSATGVPVPGPRRVSPPEALRRPIQGPQTAVGPRPASKPQPNPLLQLLQLLWFFYGGGR